ncbi:MAG: ribosome biogenesis GTPase Der [Alphaproteobacteria bacterium]|nr:ribosome biogenesis GTPase Der [Alphaproteobacteria bacterium]
MDDLSQPFRLVIVGRPNVGKSTLFNRLAGKKLAIVHDKPGVTRDVRETILEFDGALISLMDTAGLEEERPGDLVSRMTEKSMNAALAADHVLFVLDGRSGLLPEDRHFADVLRMSGLPITIVVNKCEGRGGDIGFYDAFELGMGEPIAVSAEHNEGMGELWGRILSLLDAHDKGARDNNDEETDTPLSSEEEQRPIHLALVGRPNAGKSTLFNKLLGQERSLTGPEAGITRDTVSVSWQWQGQSIKLFDTAGMRRRARVVESLEKLSVHDSLRAIRFADVVVLLVDAVQGLEKQDFTIAEHVEREGRALVVALSKWDLVGQSEEVLDEAKYKLSHHMSQLKDVPFIPISAVEHRGIPRLMKNIIRVHETWDTRVTTAQLNKWLGDIEIRNPPPAPGGRRIRLRYITQIKSRPPTFILFVSRPEELPASYTRFLVNDMREQFNLSSIPIRLYLRRGDNPYKKS